MYDKLNKEREMIHINLSDEDFQAWLESEASERLEPNDE